MEDPRAVPQPSPAEDRHATRLIVDGMNVIGSRPDGWWRDRKGAARRLVAQLQALAASGDDALTVVLDGRPLPGLPEGAHRGVTVYYATRPGPNAADDRIIDLIAADADPGSLTIVTSDRTLRERALHLRAEVVGAGALLRHLDALEG